MIHSGDGHMYLQGFLLLKQRAQRKEKVGGLTCVCFSRLMWLIMRL